MEYVEGEALSRTLHRFGRLSPAVTMDLVAQAADALQAVHDRGIVHRDVKPANLLLRNDGALMVTDFGIARTEKGTALTATGVLLGTLSYLAPEQVLGRPATPRSDVYALGLVAYECLVGRRPFVGDTPMAAAMQRVWEAPPPLDGDVPPPVAAVVERALAADPAQRWSSAADLAIAARSVLADQGRSTAPVPPQAAGAGQHGVGVWSPPRVPGQERRRMPASCTDRPAPTGFVRQGDFFYPSTPMFWGGLTIPGGVGREPRRIDHDEPHYWETFAVGYLPEDAIYLRQEELMNRADIAAACSEAVLAQRSRDPSRTVGWLREPWPVQIGRETWIFHCLASPGEGEWTGSAFRSGA